MHAFSSNGTIKKYNTPNDILNEFVGVRLSMYVKRREHQLAQMKAKLPYHENVVRFIHQQCESTPCPDLRRKSPEDCDKLLENEKFARIKDGFDYLLDLPIKSLTLKNAQKHEKDLADLKQMIAELEGKSARDLWLDELSKLLFV
jgi:DNA topoisomerase-2